jgi:hypothetical protein
MANSNDICRNLPIYPSIYLSLYLTVLVDLGHFFSFLIHTVGSTPWTGDQAVARPLSYTQNNTHTE